MGYKHFDMTDLIDKALNEGNLRSARRVISDICPSDRTFITGEFEDALEYVRKIKRISDSEIFEPFDPDLKPLYSDRVDRKDPTLEEDDFAASVAVLKENFCPERIEDTKKLGRYLFPDEMKNNKSVGSAQSGNTSSNELRKYLSNISELLKVGYNKIKEIDRETSKAIDSGDIESQSKLEEKRKSVSLIMKKCNQYVSIIAKDVKKTNKKAIESIMYFDTEDQLEYNICALEAVVLENSNNSIIQKLKTMWKKFITNVFNFFRRITNIIKNKLMNMKIKSTSKKIKDDTSINLSKEDKEYLDKLPDEIKKIINM